LKGDEEFGKFIDRTSKEGRSHSIAGRERRAMRDLERC
jgi:hypothetical protein